MKHDVCRETDLVDLYFGDLDPQERDRVEKHLKGCSGCRAEFGNLRRILDRIRPTETEFSAAEINRFAARVAGRAAESTTRRFPAWSLSLAGAAVLAVFLVARWPQEVAPPPQSKLAAGREIVEDMEFLRDLPILENLDWLRELEGSG